LSDKRGGPVRLEPKEPDRLGLQDPSRLFGDRMEDLRRRRLACDQLRDAPQRGLLLGEP
jgi:hypothetical protein